jgi:glycosyltransferase involved in cell wall biosynthesis
MRVLFLTNSFPNPLEPTRGTYNAYTARSLSRFGEVVVISHIPWINRRTLTRGGAVLPSSRHENGLEIHHPTYWYPPGICRQTYGTFLWWSIRATVRRVLQRFQPDVVLSFWVHPDGDAALRVAAECGVPGVVIAGGSDVLVLGQDAARRRHVVDVLTRADAVVCVSEHLKRAVGALGVPDQHVHVVHNGIDLDRFAPGDRDEARARLSIDSARPVLLWVGRMAEVKGLDVLLDAFASTKDAEPEAVLCLVGDGPLRSAVEQQAVRLGIRERIRFAGNVTHDALADWYRAADVTLLPSHSEGSPNVLLESIACGTPFIASAVGGIPEFADADLDRLVPPGDAVALGLAMRERLANRRPAGPARRLCTWDEHGDAMRAVFEQALNARKRRMVSTAALASGKRAR